MLSKIVRGSDRAPEKMASTAANVAICAPIPKSTTCCSAWGYSRHEARRCTVLSLLWATTQGRFKTTRCGTAPLSYPYPAVFPRPSAIKQAIVAPTTTIERRTSMCHGLVWRLANTDPVSSQQLQPVPVVLKQAYVHIAKTSPLFCRCHYPFPRVIRCSRDNWQSNPTGTQESSD